MTPTLETHDLRVERSARYFTLGDSRGAHTLWFVLHGYGQSAARFLTEFEPLATPGRLFVAPEGLSRFYLRGTAGRIGASWMTSEERATEIRDYVAYLDAVRDALALDPAVKTGVLGFSQGAATAARWAVLGARPPQHLVLCSGGLPPDLDPERTRAALAETEVTLIVGDADPHLDAGATARDQARLESLAIRTRTRVFEGPHRLDLGALATCLDGRE